MGRLCVVDKSFLQGISLDKYFELSKFNTFLLTDVCFMEILTSEKDERENCFRKLCLRQPILFPHIGQLIQAELKEGRCCYSLDRFFIKAQLNEKFKFVFNREQEKHIHNMKISQRKDMTYFIECAKYMNYWFPELRISNKHSLINSIVEKIINDVSFIQNVYQELFLAEPNKLGIKFPDKLIIDSNWAVFRHLQCQLLWCAHYYEKYYNGESFVFNRKKLINDVTDMEYCVLATLTGILATEDKNLRKKFLQLKSDGLIISIT